MTRLDVLLLPFAPVFFIGGLLYAAGLAAGEVLRWVFDPSGSRLPR